MEEESRVVVRKKLVELFAMIVSWDYENEDSLKFYEHF